MIIGIGNLRCGIYTGLVVILIMITDSMIFIITIIIETGDRFQIYPHFITMTMVIPDGMHHIGINIFFGLFKEQAIDETAFFKLFKEQAIDETAFFHLYAAVSYVDLFITLSKLGH